MSTKTVEQLPFSQACENNKSYIMEVLLEAFADNSAVLEIASGTGQHACHFAAHMRWLQWQPTELAEHLPYLHPRCADYPGDNLLAETVLDVCDEPWPVVIPDAVFTANSLHIMPFSSVEKLFLNLAAPQAPDNTVLAIYGPFNYCGRYTSESNARFDQWLAQQNPDSAIRDFEAVNTLATAAGFTLQRDCEMPANNRLIVWRREPA